VFSAETPGGGGDGREVVVCEERARVGCVAAATGGGGSVEGVVIVGRWGLAGGERAGGELLGTRVDGGPGVVGGGVG